MLLTLTLTRRGASAGIAIAHSLSYMSLPSGGDTFVPVVALMVIQSSRSEPNTMLNRPLIIRPPAHPLEGRPPRHAGSACLFLMGSLLTMLAIACSDGGGGGGETAPVSFGISDAPIEGLESVVITIDRITLNRPGNDDVVLDHFTNEELGVFDADTITVDLLDYRGEDNLLIVGPVELDVGDFQNLRLEIIDEDIELTYVKELEEFGGAIRPLKVPSGELKLGRFEVEDSGEQTFILEFGLRKAMTYNPGPDRYILKPRGVRVVEVARGTSIEGMVEANLFNGAPPCREKTDPFDGNVMYLYQGTDLDPANFADDFDPELDLVAAAASYLEPFATETVADDGSYLFSYLPAGNYTLAFSCDATEDRPNSDDDIIIPSPEGELVEVVMSPGERWACDFAIAEDGCELLLPETEPEPLP